MQYSSLFEESVLNLRVRWIYTPGSEAWIVYDEGRRFDLDPTRAIAARSCHHREGGAQLPLLARRREPTCSPSFAPSPVPALRAPGADVSRFADGSGLPLLKGRDGPK